MNKQLVLDSFERLFAGASTAPRADITQLHERLLGAWSEPHRAYHAPQHLAECLDLLAEADVSGQQATMLGLALWFHDAVYDVRGSDNEELSAAWAVAALTDLGVPAPTVSEVERLVLATRHLGSATPGSDELASWMLDIDLSILGAPAARFCEYEQQIRVEYSWVPADEYALARRRVMHHFAEQARAGALYRTAWGRRVLLPRAMQNLSAYA